MALTLLDFANQTQAPLKRGIVQEITNESVFLRRLRFVVTFPFPDLAARELIWRGVFPAAAPTEGLRFDKLARLNVTGGNIRTIALNAAFAAAEHGGPVTMADTLAAARTEYAKLERPLTDIETRGWL